MDLQTRIQTEIERYFEQGMLSYKGSRATILRFFSTDFPTYHSIGKSLGITRERVRTLLWKAGVYLRHQPELLQEIERYYRDLPEGAKKRYLSDWIKGITRLER